MHTRRLLTALTVAAFAAACSSDDLLRVDPATIVAEDQAINDAQSARAAVLGMYDALQSDSYYGEQFLTFADLGTDNALHTGTFTTYADVDRNELTSENSSIEGTWDAIYRSINRANVILERIPAADFLDAAEAKQMQAEALFVRALGYHNLVKLFGGVPLRLTPIETPADVATVTRASVTEVYAQILGDLTAAQGLVQVQRSGLKASLGAIRALRARVLFYRGDHAAAEAEANAVLAMGYALTPTYSDLFTAAGTATSEDIFRIKYTGQDAASLSYYYMDKSLGGRRELGPTAGIRGQYVTGDVRGAWNIRNATATRFYVSKFRSVTGTEHPHVIRLAEVILIKAEAQARQNKLAEAVATLNLIRARAGVPAVTLGSATLTTQAQVIDAIIAERRLELAFEGDRWHDLVRSGKAVATLGLTGKEYQVLYPIPQGERDVAQGLEQNPGY